MGRGFDATVGFLLLVYGAVQLVEFALNYLHYIWIAGILTLVVGLGASSLGLTTLFLVIGEQYYLGKLNSLKYDR